MARHRNRVGVSTPMNRWRRPRRAGAGRGRCGRRLGTEERTGAERRLSRLSKCLEFSVAVLFLQKKIQSSVMSERQVASE